jgi:5-methylcytosine-specific restriction endonuclease McrA
MRIRPSERAKYPATWKEISFQVRQAASWCCEQCGVQQGTPLVDGYRVGLKTAHVLNPNPSDCREENLRALCQACHNRLEGAMRARHARETRQQRRISAGQRELF